MTEAELKQIEERAANATTAPWTHEIGFSGDNWLVGSIHCGTVFDGKEHSVNITTDHVHASEVEGSAEGDAAFIAASRSDVPKLCAEVRRLHHALEFYEGIHGTNWEAEPGRIARDALKGSE